VNNGTRKQLAIDHDNFLLISTKQEVRTFPPEQSPLPDMCPPEIVNNIRLLNTLH